jgi:hypothetical protein
MTQEERDTQTGDGLPQLITEIEAMEGLFNLLKECPIPDDQLLQNLTLFMHRRIMSRLLFMTELYKSIIPINGIVMEFGVRWGRNVALFESLRGVYEPYNHTRKIVGFDTFSGFPSVHKADGDHEIAAEGSYSVTEDYDTYLEKVLAYQNMINPIPQIKKHELIKGDATKTITQYFDDHPETIVSLAYFDFDIYEPTRDCLAAILPHTTKGTVIGFDELNCSVFPGETIALNEVVGIGKYSVRRLPFSGVASYIVLE